MSKKSVSSYQIQMDAEQKARQSLELEVVKSQNEELKKMIEEMRATPAAPVAAPVAAPSKFTAEDFSKAESNFGTLYAAHMLLVEADRARAAK